MSISSGGLVEKVLTLRALGSSAIKGAVLGATSLFSGSGPAVAPVETSSEGLPQSSRDWTGYSGEAIQISEGSSPSEESARPPPFLDARAIRSRISPRDKPVVRRVAVNRRNRVAHDSIIEERLNQMAVLGKSIVESDPESSIAFEVKLLESDRKAYPRRSLRLADDFIRNLPGGSLVTEAEVVTMDALSALGQKAALDERARRFLKRYPGDLHSQRVENWLSTD